MPNRALVHVKHFLRWFVSCVTCSTGQGSQGKPNREEGLRVLMYHDIRDDGSADPFCVSTFNFREQMRILAREYCVVSFEDAVTRFANGDELPPRSIVVTFDDGYRGLFDNALPILLDFDMSATVFIRCDVLETGLVPGEAKAERNYMIWDEVTSASQAGVAIGAHTINHRSLARIPFEQAATEIDGSKKCIEEHLRKPIRLFSYPYGTGGDINGQILHFVEQAEFAAAVTAINGTNTSPDSLFALRRTKVEGRDSLATFRRLLQGGMDPWSFIDKFGWRLQAKRRC